MPQPEDFMSRPAKVFTAYIQLSRESEGAFQLGMLGMALEIITRIKVLESLPVTTEVGRQEAITVLQTMLTELGISDYAYEWYERLSEWRRPKFQPDASSRLDEQLERALPSDVPGGPLRPGPPISCVPASAGEWHRVVPALPAGSDESA